MPKFAIESIIERRAFDAALEVRGASVGRQPRLAGYAAKFNKLSHPIGSLRFREKIDPRAFDETLAAGADVRFTLNHNPNYVMGRTAAGTLKLQTDQVGLHFELDPPDSSAAEHLISAVKRGDISSCSFSFRTLVDAWGEDKDGNTIRTLKKVSLDAGDVAAVAYPAYPDTTIDARSIDAIERRGRQVLGLDYDSAALARERELAAAMASCSSLVGRLAYFGEVSGPTRGSGRKLVFERGAFSASIRRDRVVACDGHDEAQAFACTDDGTLLLGEDTLGPWFEVFERDNAGARLMHQLVRSGRRRHVSAGFIPRQYEDRGGVRHVYRADLEHIALLNEPAFRRSWITPAGEGLSSEQRVRGAELKLEMDDCELDEDYLEVLGALKTGKPKNAIENKA